MRSTRSLWLCLAVVGWSLVGSASAQQTIRWRVDLETAKRLASQTNRMVLVHFWADWCQPCRRMEQDVFARPEVVAAVESRFVPVKINADHFPHTRQQYGITMLPTDLILAPNGQVVGRIASPSNASQYVLHLNQIAALAENRGPLPAQHQGLAAAQPGRASGPPSTFGPGSAPPGDQGTGSGAPQAGQFVGQDGRPPAQAMPAGPSYAGHSGPNARLAPNIKIPPANEMAHSRTDSSRQGGPMGPRPSEGSPRVGAMEPTSPGASFDVASNSPPNPQPPQLPPGSPPLGLEGYCPVELTDSQHWVRGDTRWGLTYKGRTYLFAGPDQRDRFDAAPDRYAPVLAGVDVVLAVDQGDTVPGQRRYGAWFEDRVYLFSSEATLRRFDEAPYRYVSALQETGQSTARRPAYGPRVERPAANSASQAPYGAWR